MVWLVPTRRRSFGLFSVFAAHAGNDLEYAAAG